MKSNKKALVWGIVTLVWTGVIFMFSLQPANQSANLSGGILTHILEWIYQWTGMVIPIEAVHNLFRKLAHFIEFFLLGLFAMQFFGAMKKRPLWAFGYGALIAVVDETIQFFTGAGRAMRFSDMVLDTFGVFVALLFLWIFAPKSKKKNR